MRNIIKIKIDIVVIFAAAVGTAFLQTGAIEAASVSTDLSSPRSLYVQNCAGCHGRDGHSNTAQGRETEADDLTGAGAKGLSPAKAIRIITTGRGDMPGFGKRLTAAQIKSIAAYIRKL